MTDDDYGRYEREIAGWKIDATSLSPGASGATGVTGAYGATGPAILIGALLFGSLLFGLVSGAGGLAFLMNAEPGLTCEISGGSYDSHSRGKGARGKGVCAYPTGAREFIYPPDVLSLQDPEQSSGHPPSGQTPEQSVADSPIKAPVEDPRIQAPLSAADILGSLIQANLPWTGPHDAEIFFFTFEDYQCPHCRDMHEARVAYFQDSSIPKKVGPKKAAFIHLPIGRVNALSDIGARIAIAGWLLDPTRFDALQEALFASTSSTDIQNRLTAINFSYGDLLAASHQPQFNAIIEGVAAMASGLDIRGTPTTLAWAGRDRVLTLEGSMTTEQIVATAKVLSEPEVVGVFPPDRGEGTD